MAAGIHSRRTFDRLVEEKARLTLVALISVSVVLGVTATAGADTVSVGCVGGTLGTYSSITAALNALPSKRGHQIMVSGTCAEQVRVVGFENLNILGNPVAAVVNPPGLAQGAFVFEISVSKTVFIRNLRISAGGFNFHNLKIDDSTDVTLDACTIEGGGFGVAVSNQSHVRILDGAIQNNFQGGLSVAGPAIAEVLGNASGVTIRGNPIGILVQGGYVGMARQNLVTGNQTGIYVQGGTFSAATGRIRACEPVIRENDTGIVLQGGRVELAGCASVESNRGWGILALGGHVATIGRGPDPLIKVRNNGTNASSSAGGIAVAGGFVELDRAEITGNANGGVVLTDSASGRIVNATVTSNGSFGVRVQSGSAIRLFSGAVLQNNVGFDLSCTPDSAGRGDRRGVARMFCPGFDDTSTGITIPNPIPGGPSQ